MPERRQSLAHEFVFRLYVTQSSASEEAHMCCIGWSAAQLTLQAEHAVQRSAARASELREARDGLILTTSPHISIAQVRPVSDT